MQPNYSEVDTPLGPVRKLRIDGQVPAGWRQLEYQEAQTIKQDLNKILDQYSIVGLKTGKLDGSGYGNKFSQTRGSECGQKFIILAAPSVDTSIGTVRKVSKDTPLPTGWRNLQFNQGRHIKQLLNRLLEQWSIVSLNGGKLDGPGYGNKFTQAHGVECGEKFIIYPLQHRVPQTETSLGSVRKVGFKEPLTAGWRNLQLNQGRQIHGDLNKLLDQWSIVALNGGKIDGPGYGNKFTEAHGVECGEKFIIKTKNPK